MKLPGIITISIAIIALSVAYYYVIFLPGFQKEKLEYERAQTANQAANLEFCLKDAESEYDSSNSLYLKAIEDGKFDGFSAESIRKIFDDLKATLQTRKNECFKIYK